MRCNRKWSGSAKFRAAVLAATLVLPVLLICPATAAEKPSGEGDREAPEKAPPPAPAPPFAMLFQVGALDASRRDALLACLGDHVVFGLNYERMEPAPGRSKLGRDPAVSDARAFARTAGGRRLVIELGIKSGKGGAAQLVAFAAEEAEGGQEASRDGWALFEAAEQMVGTSVKQAEAAAQPPAERELAHEFVTLSYVTTDRVIGLLKALGYNAVEYEPAKGDNMLDRIYHPVQAGQGRLPLIVKLADAPVTTLVSEKEMAVGLNALNLPSTSGQKMDAVTAAGPQQRLLVVYDRADKASLRSLLMMLKNKVDIPARQIVIEALVIEVREDKLKDLGLEFEASQSDHQGITSFGAKFQGDPRRFFTLSFDDRLAEARPSQFRAALKMLIEEGAAEILSKPSVVALNNRQARIQVGQEIPISKTIATEVSEITSVDYFHVGIVLNIKPRISEDEGEVSMQIETIVSGVSKTASQTAVPTVQIAPVVDTRHVQTFARITNGTPFIIGGLIAHDKLITVDRVPLLSRIPYVGGIFRRTTASHLKTEVIVVLTPHIVPATIRNFSYLVPKDSDKFDSIGRTLYRNAYRIRSTDVFDLNFLKKSGPVVALQQEVATALEGRPELADLPQLKAFHEGYIPGEEVFVRRMLFEILGRLDFGRHVATDNVLFFAREDTPGAESVTVQRLRQRWLATKGQKKKERAANADRALVIAFPADLQDGVAPPARQQVSPVPEVSTTRLRTAHDYDSYLAVCNEQENQPTIILRDESDVERLKLCLLLKEAIALNSAYMALTLRDFHVGRQIVLPNPEDNPRKQYVIDPQVARYFYQSRLYYKAFDRQFSKQLQVVRSALKSKAAK